MSRLTRASIDGYEIVSKLGEGQPCLRPAAVLSVRFCAARRTGSGSGSYGSAHKVRRRSDGQELVFKRIVCDDAEGAELAMVLALCGSPRPKLTLGQL